MLRILFLFCGCISTLWLHGEVMLPALFSDHMILQRNSEVRIWGWAMPKEEITITTSWDNKDYRTAGDSEANWSLLIKTPEAGGPYTIRVKGHNEIVLNDVLIGEVWLCSGQSNMQWTFAQGTINAAEEISAKQFPKVRQFKVGVKSSEYPQQDVMGKWVEANSESLESFSAVAYYFGKKIHEYLDVPVGIINSSWGGTPIQVWMPESVVEEDSVLSQAADRIKETEWSPHLPGRAFNAMLNPLIPYEIAGTIWYQGESNIHTYQTYPQSFSSMIKSWRDLWNDDFPFYFVQIAPYKYGNGELAVRLREAQANTVQMIENTGMIVISDVGNVEDIHPRNKKDVGERLANMALSETYGKTGLTYKGPELRKTQVEGRKLRLNFINATSLEVIDEDQTAFELAGADQVYYPAKYKIFGNSIVLYSPLVKVPVAARFAWREDSRALLVNEHGLPASSFRTDDWPVSKE